MDKDTPHSLNSAFETTESAKPSALENRLDAIRKEAEEKIANIQMAADVCEEMGYNLEDIPVKFFEEAIEQVKYRNGLAHGDAYKPFDPDMAFVDRDGFKSWFAYELPRQNIRPAPKPEQKDLDLG